jgi:predicted hydrocarbon binding protein
METPPKIVRVYHDAKSKRALVGTVWLRDVPGALAAAASTLASLGINLVSSSTSNVNGTGLAEWGFFAEVEDKKIVQDKMSQAMKNTPQVVRVEFDEGNDGVVVDRFHYPLRFSSGQQGMMVSRATFSGMLTNLREVFGTGGNVIAYQLGYSTGKQDADELIGALGKERVLMNLPSLLNLYLAQGWGVPELVDLSLEPLRSTVRLHDNFECAELKSFRPSSHFIRGHLAGLAKGFFDKSVECTEVKCMAMANDYCEFNSVEM